MPATPAAVAGEAEDERDDPRGAEAAPARQQDQPQRVSPPGTDRTVTDSAALKRDFRKAAKAATAKAGPQPLRRRRGDDGGLFKVAWRALVRRTRPSQSHAAAGIF